MLSVHHLCQVHVKGVLVCVEYYYFKELSSDIFSSFIISKVRLLLIHLLEALYPLHQKGGRDGRGREGEGGREGGREGRGKREERAS